jgi:hypothetical protein
MIFALIIGSLYFLIGLVQIIVGFGYSADWTSLLYIPSDYIGGFILLLIGAIYIYGVKELNNGIKEGVAYVYVGIMLSLGFFVLYLLITGADIISAYGLGSEDYIGWSPLINLKPGIYLAIISLVGFLQWRDKFSLRNISTAGT